MEINAQSQAQQKHHKLPVNYELFKRTWCDGRRVVELAVLAEGHKISSDCKKKFNLSLVKSIAWQVY